MKQNDASMRSFCSKVELYPDVRYSLTEQQIIKEIKTGSIFGMAEVDINTPSHLRAHFADFQPIIKHAMIDRNSIGPTMRTFAEKNDLLKRPASSLISSYFGKKILMATPLLQWLLQQGLVCDKVYQVIQWKPSQCFKSFGDEVMTARREGDADPNKKIIGDMCKLLGQ